MFLVSKIIPFELGGANSQKPEQYTCNWQSMCVYKYLYDFRPEESHR